MEASTPLSNAGK
jgi:hypothetical protein